MASQQLSLTKWVEKWNDDVFFQPDDALSTRILNETTTEATIVKLNHNFHDISGLKGGVQWVRSSLNTTLDSNDAIIEWNAPDDIGGAVVHLTVFTATDKASNKVTKKKSVVTTIVKEVDGKRNVVELVEVEVEM